MSLGEILRANERWAQREAEQAHPFLSSFVPGMTSVLNQRTAKKDQKELLEEARDWEMQKLRKTYELKQELATGKWKDQLDKIAQVDKDFPLDGSSLGGYTPPQQQGQFGMQPQPNLGGGAGQLTPQPNLGGGGRLTPQPILGQQNLGPPTALEQERIDKKKEHTVSAPITLETKQLEQLQKHYTALSKFNAAEDSEIGKKMKGLQGKIDKKVKSIDDKRKIRNRSAERDEDRRLNYLDKYSETVPGLNENMTLNQMRQVVTQWGEGKDARDLAKKLAEAGVKENIKSPEEKRQERAVKMVREQLPRLKKIMGKIEPGSPLTARGKGLIQQGINKVTGFLPEVGNYLRNMGLLAQRFGKAFESRMTDQDFLRFLNFFPKVGTTKVEREMAFESLTVFMNGVDGKGYQGSSDADLNKFGASTDASRQQMIEEELGKGVTDPQKGVGRLSPEDQQYWDWAQQNPDDPDAQKIIQGLSPAMGLQNG